jgi:hypothetical protein
MDIPSVGHLIRAPFTLSRRLMGRIQSFLRPELEEEGPKPRLTSRGESLVRLHETQNRVISSIYKISITGFAAIFMILLSFTLFLLTDTTSPGWLLWLLVGAEALLAVGFVRTLHDFRSYQKHFAEVSGRLRDLLRQQLAHATAAGQVKGEHRLIAALKPKEYQGWDAKPCRHCDRAIEMTATVCQHCGQEQETVFMN